LPREAIRVRVDKAAAMLELDGYLDRKPQLSGGERQRVAMGRALVRRRASKSLQRRQAAKSACS
jgi:ABC-type sugar transport system ATPase subunit